MMGLPSVQIGRNSLTASLYGIILVVNSIPNCFVFSSVAGELLSRCLPR